MVLLPYFGLRPRALPPGLRICLQEAMDFPGPSIVYMTLRDHMVQLTVILLLPGLLILNLFHSYEHACAATFPLRVPT
jgi:hypothetical protein